MTAGQMFYAFRRDGHAAGQVLADPKLPMWYSADFNVSPLCSVYGQGDKRQCRVTGEIFIEGSARTADMAEEFCRRHEKHENKTMTIYGDQSGANRDTRANSTDYEIMTTVFQAKGWTVSLKRNYKNPDMVESVESVNALLEKARFLIDSRCKKTIADLEQVSWKPGTRIPDKSNPALTHCADALRYHVHMEFPRPSHRATVSDVL